MLLAAVSFQLMGENQPATNFCERHGLESEEGGRFSTLDYGQFTKADVSYGVRNRQLQCGAAAITGGRRGRLAVSI